MTYEPRVCALESCQKKFTPKRKNQVFCEPSHGVAAQNSRRRGGPSVARDPKELTDERLETRKLELDRQAATIRGLRNDLKRQMEQYDSAERLRATVLDAVQAVEPVPFRAEPPATDLPNHEWMLCLSDWHIGQLTTLEETGGLFEQSTEIATDQVQTLWNALAWIYDIEASGRNIHTLHILSLGDMVDGDLMRVSQTRKVDRLVAEQYPIVAALMKALVNAALTKFAEVKVHVVGGNHDRFGKWGDAGLGELAYIENWSYILGTELEGTYANEPRVEIRNHQGFFGTAMVAGHKVVFSHGSDINWRSNSYAGIPYYSLNVAAERMKSMVDGYDVYVAGHGHTPMMLPVGFDSHMVMNGSLPGTSTYVQAKYKSIRRPAQTLVSMHHRIGVTGYTRLYLDHDGLRDVQEAWTTIPAPTARQFDLTSKE